jgi:hypothetical protein
MKTSSACPTDKNNETLIVLAGFVDLGYGAGTESNNELLTKPFREKAKQNLETWLAVPIEKYTSRPLV